MQVIFFLICLKNPAEVEIDNDGWGNFFAPAGSFSVWIEKV